MFGKFGGAVENVTDGSTLSITDNVGAGTAVSQVFPNLNRNLPGVETGIGLGYAMDHWLFGLEYNYFNFGMITRTDVASGLGFFPTGGPVEYSITKSAKTDLDLNLVKVTASYKFNA